MNNVTLGGVDPRSGCRFAYYETLGGGMGGRPGSPGLTGVHVHMSNTRNTPVEALEHALPVRVREYSVRAGSGGAGAFPGGDGLVREFELLADAEVNLITERRLAGPPGAQGGEAGLAGRNLVIRRNGVIEPLPGKVRIWLRAGDRLRIETPGGGGYGRKE
jgi:N-methylhydantoinase B/oxoprolinase/acetone carboxylase alpha subunit